MKKFFILFIFMSISFGCTSVGKKALVEVVKKTCSTLTQDERLAVRKRANNELRKIGAEFLGIRCPQDK